MRFTSALLIGLAGLSRATAAAAAEEEQQTTTITSAPAAPAETATAAAAVAAAATSSAPPSPEVNSRSATESLSLMVEKIKASLVDVGPLEQEKFRGDGTEEALKYAGDFKIKTSMKYAVHLVDVGNFTSCSDIVGLLEQLGDAYAATTGRAVALATAPSMTSNPAIWTKSPRGDVSAYLSQVGFYFNVPGRVRQTFKTLPGVMQKKCPQETSAIEQAAAKIVKALVTLSDAYDVEGEPGHKKRRRSHIHQSHKRAHKHRRRALLQHKLSRHEQVFAAS